jgi:hypothetical protein
MIKCVVKDNKALWIPRIFVISMDVYLLILTFESFKSSIYELDLRFLFLLVLFSSVTVVAMIDSFKGGVLLLIFAVFFDLIFLLPYFLFGRSINWLLVLKNFLFFFPYIIAGIMFIVFSKKTNYLN